MSTLYLRERLALSFQPAFGWEGHAGPGGGTVEHDAADGFTNSTTERGHP